MTRINLFNNILDEKDFPYKLKVFFWDLKDLNITSWIAIFFLLIVVFWAIFSMIGKTDKKIYETEKVIKTQQIEQKQKGVLDSLFGKQDISNIKGPKKVFCYERGYYEYDAGFCKRIVNGTTEVININDLR